MTQKTVHQNPITLITPVKKDRIGTLHQSLKEIKEDLIARKHEEFENIGTIHFARWVIIDEPGEANNPEQEDAKLVFSSNFDGLFDDQIKALCTISVDLIDRIYQCCEGYPEEGNCRRFLVRAADGDQEAVGRRKGIRRGG